MDNLWIMTASEAELPQVAAAVIQSLAATAPFCLWLKGDLGAGKTTLVREVLRQLGLDRRIPVTSPTYTYLNDYQIGDSWFAHLDLYRGDGSSAQGIGSVLPSAETLGLAGGRPYQGLFVEWPERAGVDDLHLAPTHHLTIADCCDGAARQYQLLRATSSR